MASKRPETVVYVGTSLDGFIARPDGAIDWLGEPVPGEDYGFAEFMATIDAVVMGRRTFEQVLTFPHWSFGDKPVVVLSSTLTAVPERLAARVELASHRDALLERLVERGCRRVYVDGGQTIQGFLRADAIDELVLTRLPVLIGEGVSLFCPVGRDLAWEHVDTRVYRGGLVKSRYRRKR